MLEAMAALMAERGNAAGTVTAAEVIARAGVPAAAFRRCFADREACLLAAFELALELVAPEVQAAYQAESGWVDGIKAGLAVFLRFLEREPELGRLLVVHSMGGGAEVLERRAAVLEELAAVVDAGRQEAPPDRQPSPLIAEGVVGAVLAILQNRMQSERPERPTGLFGSLVSMIVLPYLGAGAARRELLRPPPRIRSESGAARAGAGESGPSPRVRLTYRTRRVLGSIGDYPGASNREVAERAGIVDQGQVSKLLGRLEASALIERLGEGRQRGAANAWRLTERGERLLSGAEASRARR
jgi:AcrR family transcriptional regulator/DNA-binding MarR family transcriptional regulator